MRDYRVKKELQMVIINKRQQCAGKVNSCKNFKSIIQKILRRDVP